MGWDRAVRSSLFSCIFEGDHQPVAETVVVGRPVHCTQAVDVARARLSSPALMARPRRRQIVSHVRPQPAVGDRHLQLVTDSSGVEDRWLIVLLPSSSFIERRSLQAAVRRRRVAAKVPSRHETGEPFQLTLLLVGQALARAS